MARDKQVSRRAFLKYGIGVGALAAGASACDPGPNRCVGGPPSLPAAPDGSPAALLSGIDTIVVVMLENRSFDHLFGALAMDGSYPGAGDVDGLTGIENNPDSSGNPVTVNLAPAEVSTLDPKHDWVTSHRAFNQGRNDQFVIVNPGGNQAEVMSYHRRETAPFLYSLADQSVVCDRWFSSVMGPTWPNRYYLHAATAAGNKTNLPMGFNPPPTVWDRLAERCVSAGYYYAGAVPWYSVTFPAKSFSGDDSVDPKPVDRFFQDAAHGALPSFSIIDPDFGVNDGHPPYDFALAEAFLSSIYRALFNSVHWARSLLVVMFDEHGGYFDHVPPPQVPDPNPDFRQIGFRVPALVAGPTVRAGSVVSTTYEHVSILSTLATRFGIQTLGPRMDAAADLSACIDPERAGAPISEFVLPPAVQVRAAAARDAHLRPTSQPEMNLLAAAGRVPPHHLDRREPHERVRAWLRWAQELEAVRVVG